MVKLQGRGIFNMLSCIYNNEDFNNKQEGYCEKNIKELGLSKQLFCPKCYNPVYFCAEGKITSHFKHFGRTCENSHLYKYDINSERHYKATDFVYAWIKSQYPTSKIIKDKYLLNEKTDQKADLYFETDIAKIVLEIQFRHINFTDLLDRRKSYKSLGIKDIWIFVKNELYIPGTPYERYYINSYGELITEEFTYKSKNVSKNEITMICKKPEDPNTIYDISIINSIEDKKIRITPFILR